MVLHSTSRLGILSYLYQQRHQIAYTIGMIAELPIAMCNSDYNFNGELLIQSHDMADSTLPPTIFIASEIHLFFTRLTDIAIDPNRLLASLNKLPWVVVRDYTSPSLSIFHPPS